LGNLILNENMKLYRRWRTWVMVAMMIGAVLLGSFVEWYYDDKQAPADAWRQEALETKRDYAEMLQDDELSEEARTYYRESIMLLDYRLAHNIQPEDGTMWDGINSSAELMILITLFMVIVAGDSMAAEFSTGTIKLLLIRPASRLQVMASKYIATILFGLLLLVLLFVVSTLANGLLYQFRMADLPLLSVDAEGQVRELSMVANLWKTYLLNGVSTVMIVTMAFMISTAFRSSAMAIGVSLFALFAGTVLMELLQRYAWSKYILFANLDLSQHLVGRSYQPDMTLTFSILVLAAYFALFNLTAWLVFTRRDVAA